MMDTYVVAVEGISALRSMDTIPANVKRAAMRAVNATLTKTRTAASREIRNQVAFPARYLDSTEDGRLQVTERATGDNLEGAITGRGRPTSLARFSTSSSKKGVRVEVAPGFSKLMRRAFLIRLRAGSQLTETKNNMGLAIRLKPGETVANKKVMVPLKPGSNVYILYGPSVDQLSRSVFGDLSDEAAANLEAEFLRLMELDS